MRFILCQFMVCCSISFYIAAPTTTLDPNIAKGTLIEIEQRDPKELTHHQGVQVAASGINVSLFTCTGISYCDILPSLRFSGSEALRNRQKPPIIQNKQIISEIAN